MDIRPLTRRYKNGDLYERMEQVEDQIKSLLMLSAKEIMVRASIQDRADPRYIQEECIVYWIREAHYRGDKDLANDLAGILLQRCAQLLRKMFYTLGPDNMQQAKQDMITDLFMGISDLDSSRADFLQVRFWTVLKRMATTIYSKYSRTQRRTISFAEETDMEEYNYPQVMKESEIPDPRNLEEEIGNNELLKRALAQLAEPYRSVFIMRSEGWPIESKEPGARTLSSLFQKDPRTIRNWLRRAEVVLQEWKEKEQI